MYISFQFIIPWLFLLEKFNHIMVMHQIKSWNCNFIVDAFHEKSSHNHTTTKMKTWQFLNWILFLYIITCKYISHSSVSYKSTILVKILICKRTCYCNIWPSHMNGWCRHCFVNIQDVTFMFCFHSIYSNNFLRSATTVFF